MQSIEFYRERPISSEMREALKKCFGHRQIRDKGLRNHELIEVFMAGNPLSIKMLAVYFKNQDSEFKIKDLYEQLKDESKNLEESKEKSS